MSYADFGIHRFWKYSAFLQFLRCSFPRSNTSAKFHGYARTTVSRLLPIHHHRHEYHYRMGLLSGGDDYVLKPFSLKELDARIIAHLKREERLHRKKEQRFYGELVIDYASKCVHIKGNALELTKLEYEIIEFLSMNPEMVFDKERIYEKIGGYDAEGDSRVVTELIRRIRKKMKMYSEHEYIATVWGRGYKWAK